MTDRPPGARVDDVTIRLDGSLVVDRVSMCVEPGTIAAVIGPNGAGKSTLLRAIYRHLRPDDGTIVIGADDIWKLKPARAARRVSAVPQERPVEFDLTVLEIVAMGRTPHRSMFQLTTHEDRSTIADAIEQAGLSRFADRPWSTLSGGERQRVLIARAVAQDTPVLVLDEPTNHLDIRHQLEVMTLIRRLEVTAIMAVHDINLAAAWCDTLHLLSAGRLIASGPPADVLTRSNVNDVFGVDCEIRSTGRAVHLTFALAEEA